MTPPCLLPTVPLLQQKQKMAVVAAEQQRNAAPMAMRIAATMEPMTMPAMAPPERVDASGDDGDAAALGQLLEQLMALAEKEEVPETPEVFARTLKVFARAVVSEAAVAVLIAEASEDSEARLEALAVGAMMAYHVTMVVVCNARRRLCCVALTLTHAGTTASSAATSTFSCESTPVSFTLETAAAGTTTVIDSRTGATAVADVETEGETDLDGDNDGVGDAGRYCTRLEPEAAS